MTRTESTDGVLADFNVSGSTGHLRAEGQRRIISWRRLLDGPRLAQLAAALPVFAMAGLVLRSSEMQFYDYWYLLPKVVNPNGTLAESKLVFYYNGHILTLPMVVYWLNYKLFSGLNSTLGIFVLGLGGGQVLLLRRLLISRTVAVPWTRALLFVAFACFTFAPQGAHTFAHAMSGTAWLMANVLAFAALVLALRVRSVPSLLPPIGFATLATFSYGTGLMTWPALLVATLLRDVPRHTRIVCAVASATAVGVFFGFYERPHAQGSVGLDFNDVLRRTVQVLGTAVSPSSDTAVLAGTVAFVAAGYLVVRAVRSNLETAVAPVALIAYAVFGAAMIGFARGGNNTDIGASSRYTPLSAVFWCAVLALAVRIRPRDMVVALGGIAVAGLTLVSGQRAVLDVEHSNIGQDELAIAMRLGVSQDYPPLTFDYPNIYQAAVPRVTEIGHYPFSGEFDAGCLAVGETMETDLTVGEVDGMRGTLDGFTISYNNESVRMYGWVLTNDVPLECVTILDSRDRVVGGAAYGTERQDVGRTFGAPTNNLGFNAVALDGRRSYRAAALLQDGRLVLLDGVLRTEKCGLCDPSPGQAGAGRAAAERAGTS